MVTDGVDLGLVLPVHGALRGRSFLLAMSRTHMYFPWQGAPGVEVAKLSGFGSSGAFFGTRCAFAFSGIPLIFGGENSEVPLPWGLL